MTGTSSSAAEAGPEDDVVPEVRLAGVDWKQAKKRARIDAADLPPEARKSIDRIDVPVLLPDEPDMLETLELMGGDGWYSATLEADGRSVMILGSRVQHDHDLPGGDRSRLDDAGIELTRTSGLVTCSFSEGGVAYSVEVECQGKPGVAFCSTDDKVHDFVRALAFAGGTGA